MDCLHLTCKSPLFVLPKSRWRFGIQYILNEMDSSLHLFVDGSIGELVERIFALCMIMLMIHLFTIVS